MAGQTKFTMHIGEIGKPVILSLRAATQHIVHVRKLVLERLCLAGELQGVDQI